MALPCPPLCTPMWRLNSIKPKDLDLIDYTSGGTKAGEPSPPRRMQHFGNQPDEGSCYFLPTQNNCCEILGSVVVNLQDVRQSFFKTSIYGISCCSIFELKTSFKFELNVTNHFQNCHQFKIIEKYSSCLILIEE